MRPAAHAAVKPRLTALTVTPRRRRRTRPQGSPSGGPCTRGRPTARAFAAYRQALAVTTPAVLLAAVHAATRAGAWPEEVRYIPAAASWLRDQRWTDEHPKPKSEIPPWERFA